MVVQIDSREKEKAIKKIIEEFDKQGIRYYTSKLWTGDYMSLDNPRLIVDRKQNLSELCGNVCGDHKRFRNEILRARDIGVQLVFLCEHGKGVECLEDVIFWDNPRRHVRQKIDGRWQTVETNAMTGETLYKILSTMRDKYGVRFEFCSKEQTGARILEILQDDK